MSHCVREEVAQAGEILVDGMSTQGFHWFHGDDLRDGLVLVFGDLPNVWRQLDDDCLEIPHEGFVDMADR